LKYEPPRIFPGGIFLLDGETKEHTKLKKELARVDLNK